MQGLFLKGIREFYIARCHRYTKVRRSNDSLRNAVKLFVQSAGSDRKK